MSDFGKLGPGIVEGAIQSLLEAKRYASQLENFVSAVIPLLENEEMEKKLLEVRESAAKAAYTLQQIYDRNAKEALGAK